MRDDLDRVRKQIAARKCEVRAYVRSQLIARGELYLRDLTDQQNEYTLNEIRVALVELEVGGHAASRVVEEIEDDPRPHPCRWPRRYYRLIEVAA